MVGVVVGVGADVDENWEFAYLCVETCLCWTWVMGTQHRSSEGSRDWACLASEYSAMERANRSVICSKSGHGSLRAPLEGGEWC